MKLPFDDKTVFSRLLPAAAGVLAGTVLGFFLHSLITGTPAHQPLELRQTGWQYINPLLDCEQAADTIENRELTPFKQKVKHFIDVDLNKKWADRISVYFRELNDGPWFTIGETDRFHPASLLKVPLMIAVLKEAEANPTFLKKKIRYSNRDVETVQNVSSERLALGSSYTVEELLNRMIRHSDNVPTYLLDNTVDLAVLEQTYHDLGLTTPYYRMDKPSMVLASSDYMISAETYAAFLRILFNASYLSKQMSNKALEILSESDFQDGLVRGVPAGVKVAHKWGYHETGPHDEIKQLHDCGIVYYPGHPYLLCVMTSGSSYEYLDDAIREISRTVYTEIDKQNRPTATHE